MKKLFYGICFVLLLSGNVPAEDINDVRTEVLAKTSLSWDGSHLPDYPNGSPELTILRIKIPPGAQLPLHKHPVINAGVLLGGELTVVTEDGKTIDTHGHARGTFNGTQASLDRLTPESLRFAPGIIHPRACTWNSERVLELKGGESVVEVVNKWHYGKNKGDKTAEILVFYAGVIDAPITVKEQKPANNK